MVNSPANPTGVVMPADRLAALADVAERHGAWLVSDEIYHGLSYEGPDHTVLEFTDRAFVFNGFSKAYAMTGWRLGYLIAPKSFVRTLQRLHQNFFISSNEFVQWAGVAALREGAAGRAPVPGDLRRASARDGRGAPGASGSRSGPSRPGRSTSSRTRGASRAVLRLRVRDPRRRPSGGHARASISGRAARGTSGSPTRTACRGSTSRSGGWASSCATAMSAPEVRTAGRDEPLGRSPRADPRPSASAHAAHSQRR